MQNHKFTISFNYDDQEEDGKLFWEILFVKAYKPFFCGVILGKNLLSIRPFHIFPKYKEIKKEVYRNVRIPVDK